jgi:two-component system chemotaxis sensor kinase CheA
MAKKDDAFLQKLRATFTAEANEHLKAISAGLLELEKTPQASRQQEIIESIFRDAHSLKGAARAVNHDAIESVCQPLESIFAALKGGELSASLLLFDLLHQTINGLEKLLAITDAESGADQQAMVTLLQQQLEQVLAADQEAGAGDQPVLAVSDTTPPAPGTVRISTAKLDTLFRQVEEMIAIKQAAEQHSGDLQEIGAAFATGKKVSASIHSCLQDMQRIVRKEKFTGKETLSVTKWQAILDEHNKVSRIIADKLDALIKSSAASRRMLVKMIDNLLDDAKALLMQPLAMTFDILPKIVRELARDQDKEVEITIQGSDIELDRRIQEEIKDPLIHLIRNCIDHGIETPSVRAAMHKPPRGKVSISVVQQDDGKLEMMISDDGSGIDQAKVLAAAQKSAAITPDEAAQFSAEEILSLTFRSGVSTSPIVTNLSGRGIGLAIVREKIEKLGGSIVLESQAGTGTAFRITLPVTLAAFRGVTVRTSDQYFVLPTMNVERVMRIKQEAIRTVENREVLQINGHSLSLVYLADVLGLPRKRTAGNPGNFVQAVVLSSGGERIAFAVDEILNEQEVLLKGLGKQLVRVRNFAGSTVLGSGKLAPFLNVPDLMKSGIEAAASITQAEVSPVDEAHGKSILVVEDSITARSLLKNILEASGYRVQTAVDGIDALTALKTETFDLVVSDVEMPRMDGFDLTAKIRADRKLAGLPVVLVTALGTREHRERGIDAGADAYIVKSDFDQLGLLEIIGRLI